MCLYVENIEGEVSDKPVTCYKVYRKGEGGAMEAYYTRVEYDLKEGDEVVAEGDEDISRDDISSEYWRIGRGFLHALYWGYDLLGIGYEVCRRYNKVLRAIKDNSDVDMMLDSLLRALDELCWCEMEIPTGEKYWNGVHGDICAKRMIFKKEIKVRKKSELLKLIYSRASQSEYFDGLEKKFMLLIEKYKEKGE